jgi:hypothetical protein
MSIIAALIVSPRPASAATDTSAAEALFQYLAWAPPCGIDADLRDAARRQMDARFQGRLTGMDYIAAQRRAKAAVELRRPTAVNCILATYAIDELLDDIPDEIASKTVIPVELWQVATALGAADACQLPSTQRDAVRDLAVRVIIHRTPTLRWKLIYSDKLEQYEAKSAKNPAFAKICKSVNLRLIRAQYFIRAVRLGLVPRPPDT